MKTLFNRILWKLFGKRTFTIVTPQNTVVFNIQEVVDFTLSKDGNLDIYLTGGSRILFSNPDDTTVVTRFAESMQKVMDIL